MVHDGKTVTDYLVEGGRRFVEQLLRRRVRLRCDGEPTTLSCGARLKELLPESVVLERTPRHDSQANPTERAIRTLEEQVKVLRLDFEKGTGTELLENSCLRPWLMRHAGWLDARFRVKTNGATPYQDAYDSTYSSVLLPFGELVLFRIPLLTLDAQIKTEQSTEVRVDGTRDSGVVDWTETMHTSSSLKMVERLQRTVRRLPLSQRVDVFFFFDEACQRIAMGRTGSGPTW